ncbi:MAG: HAD-IIB family hydrolase [Burkholderiaceae bacterium]|jgi:HAD superfamily hydrolase (TIGR01484 family)|nr:HAD-IIB family hydrolase [Burkholderiaceae bacterium]
MDKAAPAAAPSPSPPPQPIAQWPLADRQRITGVFTDIDDTLTAEGAITADALAALAALREAGLPVIAITGRPLGWCEALACDWPLEAIVAESGAAALIPEGHNASGRRIFRRLYQQDAATRAANAVRLREIGARILREVPGAQIATDSAGRETDLSIDHGEVHLLDPARIAQVLAIMRAEGLHATVSSIHINGGYGPHDKRAGARWIVRQRFGRDLDSERHAWAFTGDSGNDLALFEYLPNSIGVANIRRVLPALAHPPRYITLGERGAGFAEMARALLAAR